MIGDAFTHEKSKTSQDASGTRLLVVYSFGGEKNKNTKRLRVSHVTVGCGVTVVEIRASALGLL